MKLKPHFYKVGVLLILSGCTSMETIRQEIYLPCNYSGWVNIIYGLKGCSRAMSTDTVKMYVLSGDLTRCYLNTKFQEGPYDTRIFYMCSDCLQEVPSFVKANSHVTRGSMTSIKIKEKSFDVQSFYVSRSEINQNILKDELPANPIDSVSVYIKNYKMSEK